ncbi:alpha/beta fold hydrolase [Methylobrevis pamukkalensis]|uniref:Dihydrolipoyllysine-residue acetyltransferase component of acetoin cleaving system n=1 Tax=Methylobrevis pamukkalensis TaxID=1439726 RepID=A0A1E3HAQ9_9HYPH|nr:alpha/beta fold hydrolase [Methylobrevis pamukkalensis]ODN72551.1 Dihydrolipoyllysine-residue acetyltransferase component of acetoin cleaving system [Methylobrevis pamukkalensis]
MTSEAPSPFLLPHVTRGTMDHRPPVVLLHGFAGSAQGWTNLQIALERRRASIAFDLPGHGRALAVRPIGHAGVSAAAVLASLDGLGLPRVHLVGHSMGGATAMIIALKAPDRLASLTLLAPGGFGTEIDTGLLRAYARATSAEEVAPLAARFFGPEARLPRRMAEEIAREHAEPGRVEALATIAEAILGEDTQKTLPREALATMPFPVKVIWGLEDRVLPPHQADGLPGTVALHRFPAIGHMPHLELPREVARLTGEQIERE